MHHNFIYCINARTHTHTSLVPWNRDFIVYCDSPGLIKVRCPAYSYVADQKCGNLPEFLTDTSAPRDVRPVPVCVYVDQCMQVIDFVYNACEYIYKHIPETCTQAGWIDVIHTKV